MGRRGRHRIHYQIDSHTYHHDVARLRRLAIFGSSHRQQCEGKDNKFHLEDLLGKQIMMPTGHDISVDTPTIA
jgi:hypothetical protein